MSIALVGEAMDEDTYIDVRWATQCGSKVECKENKLFLLHRKGEQLPPTSSCLTQQTDRSTSHPSQASVRQKVSLSPQHMSVT